MRDLWLAAGRNHLASRVAGRQGHRNLGWCNCSVEEPLRGLESQVIGWHIIVLGCHLPHRRVLDRLAAEGATVDYASAQAKPPPALVEKAISATRGGLRITTEDHFREPVLRGGQLSIGPGNQANIVDYGATSRRQGAVDDVRKGLVLCNELPHVRSAMPVIAFTWGLWPWPGWMPP